MTVHHDASDGRRARESALGTPLVPALICIGLVVILIGTTLPGVGSRPAGPRTLCSNNLHQIGVALHDYKHAHGSLPPLYTVDGEGNPLHSWRSLLLPFIEHKALYDKLDLSKPWNDPANRVVFDLSVESYRCPSSSHPHGQTTYLALVAPDGLMRPEKSMELSHATKPYGQVIVIVEVPSEHSVPWMAPLDIDETKFLQILATSELPHYGKFNVLMLDGSVQCHTAELTADQLRAMVGVQ